MIGNILTVVLFLIFGAAMFALSSCSVNNFYIIDVDGVLSIPIDIDAQISNKYKDNEKKALEKSIEDLDYARDYIEKISDREKAGISSLSNSEINLIYQNMVWGYRKIDAITGLYWHSLTPEKQTKLNGLSALVDKAIKEKDRLLSGKEKDATLFVEIAIRTSNKAKDVLS